MQGKIKKTLICFSLIFIFIIVGFYYFVKIYQSPSVPSEDIKIKEAEGNLKKWLPSVLKTEYLPESMKIKLGGGCLIPDETEVQCQKKDSNIFGGSWENSQQNFYSELAYNKKGTGINYYSVTIYFYREINLDEKLASEIFHQYFPTVEVSFKCTEEKAEFLVTNYCTSISEKEDIKKASYISFSQRKNKDYETTEEIVTVSYFEGVPESQTLE